MHKNYSTMATYFSNPSLRRNESLKNIFEWYIKPFLLYCSDRIDADNQDNMMDVFFHAHERKILTARAAHKFRMPGMFKKCAEKHVTGVPTTVETGERLYIRLDKRSPDEVDIELPRPVSTVYRLTKKDFERILGHIVLERE